MAPNNSSAAKPFNKAEWLLLNHVEHADRHKHMLGAVVPKSGQYYPFDSYSPHWADPDLDKEASNGKPGTKKDVLRNTMESLWRSGEDYGKAQPKRSQQMTEKSSPKARSRTKSKPIDDDEPVQLQDVLAGKVAAKTVHMQTALTDLFNLFLRKHEAEEVEIKSGLVKRYTIDNPAAKLSDNLLSCEPWKEQLEKLFERVPNKNVRFLLVTGLCVCSNLEVRWKRDTNSTVNSAVKIDGNAVLAAAGSPPSPKLAAYLNSKFDFDQEKSDASNVFARCKTDVIFAIRYNYLHLDFAKNPNILSKIFLNASPEGTLRSAKMGDVALGLGIMSFAKAEEDDKEDEADGGDWFYIRPALGLKNGSEEQNSSAEGTE